MNRLRRALAAAWRAFVAEWRDAAVTVKIELPQRSVVENTHPAFGTPTFHTTFLVKRHNPEHIVYNDSSGAAARDLFLAEKAEGNTATFAMCSGGQWQLRDWCPR